MWRRTGQVSRTPIKKVFLNLSKLLNIVIRQTPWITQPATNLAIFAPYLHLDRPLIATRTLSARVFGAWIIGETEPDQHPKMAYKADVRTTFEPSRVIQPIYTGGSVALSQDGQILASCLGEEALLTNLSTGAHLARIEGVSWLNRLSQLGLTVDKVNK